MAKISLSGMKNIRVLTVNAERFTSSLIKMGYIASWSIGASTSMDNGCTDPEHCPQHHNEGDQNWSTIKTNCGGNISAKIEKWEKEN